jgi:hypothetical protein
MYQFIYGQPVGPALGFVSGGHSSDAQLPGGNAWVPGRSLAGVLFSPGRGLFVYQPWAALAFLLLCRTVRGHGGLPLPRGWYPFALAFVAFHLGVVGSWRVWWGGSCWGSRLAAEIVPVLGLLAARPIGWLLDRKWGVAVLAVIGVAGAWVHGVAMFTPALKWNAIPPGVDADPGRLWDWTDPPFFSIN